MGQQEGNQRAFRSFALELNYLPDLHLLGGNARQWNRMQVYRARQEAKDTWMALIMEKYPRAELPHFRKAHAEVTLVFRQNRKRDRENLAIALKPLWDALVALEVVPDDDPEHLDYGMPIVSIEPRMAPCTRIKLWD